VGEGPDAVTLRWAKSRLSVADIDELVRLQRWMEPWTVPFGRTMPRMSKVNTDRRRRVPPIVTAVVQPVARRLSRIEALLIEMRYEQDVQLKRVTSLQVQLDTLTEHVGVNDTNMRRVSLRRKKRVRC
jgi:hypothetical protein